MNRTTALTVTGMVLVGAIAQPSLAQEGCADIDFASAITDRFPNAAASCLGVTERDGRQFARFEAEILGASADSARARFRRQDGSFSPTYDIAINPDARVQIGGRSYQYRDLAPGQEVDIYIPPDLWEFHIPETEDFAAAQSVTVVTPTVAQAAPSAGDAPADGEPSSVARATGRPVHDAWHRSHGAHAAIALETARHRREVESPVGPALLGPRAELG